MKSILAHILTSIGAAFILTKLQLFLDSNYIIEFLKVNLITIQIALMAINGTTLGIVLSKVRELSDRPENRGNFAKTKKEMLFSIHEQIVLIIFSLILFLIHTSSWLKSNINLVELIDVFVIGCFVYALIILYDTAKSVFVLIEYEDKNG